MHKTRKVKTMLWMFGWCVFFTLLITSVKFLKEHLPIRVIIFSRNSFALFFLLPVALKKGVSRPLKMNLLPYGLTLLVGVAAMFCTYYAYQNLPLSTATAIGYTEPMMQVLLSIFVLHTSTTKKDWFFMVIGYLGVLCMVYPINYAQSKFVLIDLLANLLAAFSRVMTKYITKTEPVHQIMLYNSLTSLTLTAIIAFRHWQTPTLYQLIPLVSIGFLAFLSQYCYISAMKIADFQLIGIMTYLRIIFSAIVGFYLFAEAPTLFRVIGSGVIIMANYLLLHSQAEEPS